MCCSAPRSQQVFFFGFLSGHLMDFWWISRLQFSSGFLVVFCRGWKFETWSGVFFGRGVLYLYCCFGGG